MLFEVEVDLAKVRLINYWSNNDSWSFKDLVLESAPALQGPFSPVVQYSGLPRCAESKAVTESARAHTY